MVQTKHQKSKPRKQPQAKKHGKQVDISDFRAQLDLLELKIIQVTSDGNCFFRALADQLEGNEEKHEEYRRMVVQYIMKNRDMFEPFIEDDVPFDEYCKSMEKDGTWAGHMELQAASLVTRNNICIHRHMSPRWYIRNFDNQKARMIHLSYHDGEHYNSVRLKDDPCCGPAKPIIIKVDVNLTASSQEAKPKSAQLKARTSNNVVHGGAVKMVMAGSGCNDAEKVEQVLLQVDGDVDAAIEFLIAELEDEEIEEENGGCHENGRTDHEKSTRSNKNEENRDFPEGKDQPADTGTIDRSKISTKGDKLQKIPRNKVCPCGSKKKYKACCGAAAGKTCSEVTVYALELVPSKCDNEAHVRRSKRGKPGKKNIAITKATSRGADEILPDMGALCI